MADIVEPQDREADRRLMEVIVGRVIDRAQLNQTNKKPSSQETMKMLENYSTEVLGMLKESEHHPLGHYLREPIPDVLTSIEFAPDGDAAVPKSFCTVDGGRSVLVSYLDRLQEAIEEDRRIKKVREEYMKEGAEKIKDGELGKLSPETIYFFIHQMSNYPPIEEFRSALREHYPDSDILQTLRESSNPHFHQQIE